TVARSAFRRPARSPCRTRHTPASRSPAWLPRDPAGSPPASPAPGPPARRPGGPPRVGGPGGGGGGKTPRPATPTPPRPPPRPRCPGPPSGHGAADRPAAPAVHPPDPGSPAGHRELAGPAKPSHSRSASVVSLYSISGSGYQPPGAVRAASAAPRGPATANGPDAPACDATAAAKPD